MARTKVIAVLCPRCDQWVRPWRWHPAAGICRRCLADLHQLIRAWAAYMSRLNFPHR